MFFPLKVIAVEYNLGIRNGRQITTLCFQLFHYHSRLTAVFQTVSVIEKPNNLLMTKIEALARAGKVSEASTALKIVSRLYHHHFYNRLHPLYLLRKY